MRTQNLTELRQTSNLCNNATEISTSWMDEYYGYTISSVSSMTSLRKSRVNHDQNAECANYLWEVTIT